MKEEPYVSSRPPHACRTLAGGNPKRTNTRDPLSRSRPKIRCPAGSETSIQTPCGLAIGRQLANQTILVPVLRAGLVYAEGMAEIIPNAIFGHIGLFRDESTHRPVPYFSKLPRKLAGTQILIADPMLATGHSAVAAVDTVLNAGAEPEQIRFLALVAAPEGVRCFEAAHPHIDIRAFALDERLNDQAYIVPGLGDAGDRLFGTC